MSKLTVKVRLSNGIFMGERVNYVVDVNLSPSNWLFLTKDIAAVIFKYTLN